MSAALFRDLCLVFFGFVLGFATEAYLMWRLVRRAWGAK